MGPGTELRRTCEEHSWRISRRRRNSGRHGATGSTEKEAPGEPTEQHPQDPAWCHVLQRWQGGWGRGDEVYYTARARSPPSLPTKSGQLETGQAVENTTTLVLLFGSYRVVYKVNYFPTYLCRAYFCVFILTPRLLRPSYSNCPEGHATTGTLLGKSSFEMPPAAAARQLRQVVFSTVVEL
jgi:hypothetical protein